jgi:UDP-N-acetylglucosamine--N-acetylmuramyl-(pentapeptide) pyrophosphoryl-undecaprenol N-acetylglucosamine transferase
VVFSFGGYLAVPVAFGAWVLGIPSVTHEQTVVTGYANKFIAKFVDKILISHEDSRKHFPSEKVVYSGLPLRESLYEVKTDKFKFDNNLPVLYVTAGKTGSVKINSVIKRCLPRLLDKFNVIHQCGDHSQFNDYTDLLDIYESMEDTSPGIYYAEKFVYDDEIGEVFKKADIFLSRSGAHTVQEIKEFRKPAVLIPIPWVSHNEQLKNAQMLVKEGLGIILNEEDLTCPNLLSSLMEVERKLKEIDRIAPKYSRKPLEIMLSVIKELNEEKK